MRTLHVDVCRGEKYANVLLQFKTIFPSIMKMCGACVNEFLAFLGLNAMHQVADQRYQSI